MTKTRVRAEDKDSFPRVRRLKARGVGYELGHQISRGAFSTVYGARDMWGNALAMKISSPDAKPHLWEREVKALSRMRHPSVVYMHAAFEHEGDRYIALERCGISVSRIRPAAALRPAVCLFTARGLTCRSTCTATCARTTCSFATPPRKGRAP
jgi:hypothetical protein